MLLTSWLRQLPGWMARRARRGAKRQPVTSYQVGRLGSEVGQRQVECLENRLVLSVTFSSPTDVLVDGVQFVASGDFNGDSKSDLAVVSSGQGVSVLLANGGGGFGTATIYAIDSPRSVAIEDFNGDSKPDLAVAVRGDTDGVSVLLGNGSGSFGAATIFAVGGAESVSIGDFNGDSKPDLAVIFSAGSQGVSLLLGNGDGTFGIPTSIVIGGAKSVSIGDFNGDSKPDLAVAFSGPSDGLSVLLGDGSGGFGTATKFAFGRSPSSVVAGDFNGDSKSDLAVANLIDNNVSVRLGDGSGGFGAVTNFATGNGSASLAIGDFNGDSKPDLTVVNQFNNNVSVLQGDGSGSFGTATNFDVGNNARSLAIGDFNGDSKPDLAVTFSAAAQGVSVLLNTTLFPSTAADFEVTTLDDEDDGQTTQDSDLSLREAIRLANANANDSTITFASTLTSEGPATITLGGTELTISTNVTLTGPGVNLLAIDADGASRVLQVSDDNISTLRTVTISGLTIRGGTTTGNLQSDNGGGIRSQEDLTIEDSLITMNTTESDGGGIEQTYGTLTVRNSSITGNTALGEGGGLINAFGAATVEDSTISGNTARTGGGLYNYSAPMTLRNVTISGNSASQNGGAVANVNYSFEAAYDLEVISSTISGNSAGVNGGGVYNYGGFGGTVSALLTNSTVSGNTAGNNGGGLFNQLSGEEVDAVLTVRNCTITNNHANNDNSDTGVGGGIQNTLGTVTLLNTIVAGNFTGSGTTTRDDINILDLKGVTANSSLIGVTTGQSISGDGNLIDIDPVLGPLADNGGPTQTHALLSGSPAIDAGDSVTGAAAGDFDQRGDGFDRVKYDLVDIGAFEFVATPTLVATIDGGGNLTVTDSDVAGIDNELTVYTFDDGEPTLFVSGGLESFDETIVSSLPGASLSDQNRLLIIPLSLLTGTRITIDAGLGNDHIRLDDTHIDNFSLTAKAEAITVDTETANTLIAKNVTLAADDVTISAEIIANSGTGIVTIQPQSDGQRINLSGADEAGTLGLTDAELDFIHAGNLVIGNLKSGAITVSSDVNLTDSPTVATLLLKSSVGVTASEGALKVANLVITAGGAVTLTDSDTAITTLAVATSGTVTVAQSGDLTVGTLLGLSGITNNNGTGDVSLTSTEAGVTLKQTVLSKGAIRVSAAGDITLASNQALHNSSASADQNIEVTTSVGTVTLNGPIFSNGKITVSAPGLVTIGFDGLSNLSGSGDIAVTSTSNGVTLNGPVQSKGEIVVSAAGDISLASNQSLSNSSASTEKKLEITTSVGTLTLNSSVQSKGQITVSAPGLITIGSGGGLSNSGGTANLSVTSTGAGVTLNQSLFSSGEISVVTAGDINLGSFQSLSNSSASTPKKIEVTTSAGSASLLGSVSSKGDITVSAPGLVTIGGGGLTNSNGTGNVSVTSTSSGVTLNRSIFSQGEITVMASGNVTLASNQAINSSKKIDVSSNIGTASIAGTVSSQTEVTVTADSITLDGFLNASTGTVTLQPASAGRAITLGTEVANTLSLSDAELDQVTSKTLIIGDSNSGAITVSAALDQPSINTLSLIGNTSFAAGSGYTFQIGGTTAGTQHDQIQVTGAVTIDPMAAVTFVSTNDYKLNPADQFTLITNDGKADAVTGNFGNLPIANLLGSGLPGFVNTNGGDGNDLVLVSDTTPPTLAITPNSGATKDSPITFTFQFSETVTGFDASDVTVTNGTKGTFSITDGDTYTLAVTPSADGTVTVSVGANAVQDVANNKNDKAASASIQSDRSGPVFTSSGSPSTAENSTAVVTLAATDANGPATFAITGGADSGKFNLNDKNELSFKSAQDFEAPTDAGTNNVYDLVITATDKLGNTRTQNVAVSVTAVNDNTPVITSAKSFIIAEKTTAVVTATATDADLPTQTVTFGISGTDSSKFAINSGKLSFSPAPNFNSPTDAGGNNVYNLTITASDGAGRSQTQDVEITVAGVSVTLESGNLVVTDTTDKGLVNTLTVNADLSRQVLVITETTHTIALSVPGATRVNNKSVEVPFSAITGSKVSINAGLANDSITVTKTGSGAAFTKTLEVHGGDGNDVLIGSASNEVLDGGVGNDTLTAGLGNDTIMGGVGIDTLIESGDVNFVLTNSSMTGLGTDAVSGLELAVLTGGVSANTIDASGASFSVVLNGEDGNDVLTGSSAGDTLNGGLGNDQLFGLAGGDSLGGGAGNDVLDGGASNDTLNGGTGIDRARRKSDVSFAVTNTELRELNGSTLVSFDTLAGIETISLTGGVSANRFDLTAFNNTSVALIEGGGGNDTVLGSEGTDSITTGSGIDVIEGRGGNDTIKSGDGDDVVQGGAGNDSIDGEGANDSLVGGAGDDFLFGSSGKDTLTGNDGNDTLNGGTGSDMLSEAGDVNFVLTNSSLTGLGTDQISAFESALLIGGNGPNIIDASAATFSVLMNGGPGADILTGGSVSDSLNGGAGNDTLYGLGGQDLLFGGIGNDFLDGGASNDSLVGGAGIDIARRKSDADIRVDNTGLYESINAKVVATDTFNSIETVSITGGVSANRIDLSAFTNAGIATIQGGGGNDTVIGSEGLDVITTTSGADVIDGRGGADTILSGDGADSIHGGDGNDSLDGEGGNDTVLGDAGDDNLGGGAGSDQIDGGAGRNRLVENVEGNVTIVGTQLTSSVPGNNDSIQNVVAITLRGGTGNNLLDARRSSVPVQLQGNDGDDTLLGSSGRDLLQGGAGNDVLSGGDSIDTIDGGLGTDTFFESGNSDFAVTGVKIARGGGSTTESVSNIEGIVLIGGAGNNTLDASRASVPVTLLGGAGNDILAGGPLADVLIGGNRASSTNGLDKLNGLAGNDQFDNDPADTRTTDAGDQVLANIFSQLPSWIDAI